MFLCVAAMQQYIPCFYELLSLRLHTYIKCINMYSYIEVTTMQQTCCHAATHTMFYELLWVIKKYVLLYVNIYYSLLQL